MALKKWHIRERGVPLWVIFCVEVVRQQGFQTQGGLECKPGCINYACWYYTRGPDQT